MLLIKRCPQCRKNKSIRGFYKDKRHTDGLTSQCRQCRKEYYQRPTMIAHRKKQQHERCQFLRSAAFAKLTSCPRCVICGCIEDRMLTIDHVGGGGAQHRKETGSRSTVVFYRLVVSDVNAKFKYRILCGGCNFYLPLYGNNEQELKKAIKLEHKRISLKGETNEKV